MKNKEQKIENNIRFDTLTSEISRKSLLIANLNAKLYELSARNKALKEDNKKLKSSKN